MNKEEFLLSIPDSISLTEALSDVAVIFASASFIYRKKSQGDLEKYICFHKELKWGIYKHEDKYFLVNIGHPYKVLGIESKATLQKVTEVLTDANDDSYLEKSKIKGATVLRKTSDSEKLFLQTITEYDSKQEAFKAEELVKQIKEKTKAAPKRAAAESDRTEVSDEASVSEDEESVSEKSSDEVEVPEEIAATDEPISKEDALSEAEPDKTEVSDEASVSAVPANAADTDLASLDLKKNNNTKKDTKILVGLLIVWAPLAYVLYETYRGEPPFNGWIVSVIVFCSYMFAITMAAAPKSVIPISKITYAIFNVINSVALVAICVTYFGIGGYIPSTLNGLQWFFGLAGLAFVYCYVWANARGRRKRLAKEIKEASCLGMTVEALRKKHEKDAQDLGLTTELWKEILKADKECQDAIISGDKDVLEARGAKLKKGKKSELKAKRKKKKAELEAKRVADLCAEGEECLSSGRPFCTWCGFPESSMETVRGESGAPIWKYRNQDGSQDKRSKDNFTQAAWYGAFKCNNCGATTLTTSYIERFPSARSKIWEWKLSDSKGSGKRTASDHDSRKEGETVNRYKAHRKGDD